MRGCDCLCEQCTHVCVPVKWVFCNRALMNMMKINIACKGPWINWDSYFWIVPSVRMWLLFWIVWIFIELKLI